MPERLTARTFAAAAPSHHHHRHAGPVGVWRMLGEAHGPRARLGGAGCALQPSSSACWPCGGLAHAWGRLTARASASAAPAAPSHNHHRHAGPVGVWNMQMSAERMCIGCYTCSLSPIYAGLLLVSPVTAWWSRRGLPPPTSRCPADMPELGSHSVPSVVSVHSMLLHLAWGVAYSSHSLERPLLRRLPHP